MSKIEKQFNKRKAVGYGRLSWKRLDQRLREAGELTEQQQLRSVEVTEKGIEYTTNKIKK